MSDVQILLTRCRELGAEFTPTPEGKLKVKAPAPLPEPLREQLTHHKAEIMTLLRLSPTGTMEQPSSPQTASPTAEMPSSTIYQELCQATPKADALMVFPDWQGLLVKSSVLDMSVWVVRNHVDGIALAKETGHPALLLDDVIRHKGRTAEEARAALLPELITVSQ